MTAFLVGGCIACLWALLAATAADRLLFRWDSRTAGPDGLVRPGIDAPSRSTEAPSRKIRLGPTSRPGLDIGPDPGPGADRSREPTDGAGEQQESLLGALGRTIDLRARRRARRRDVEVVEQLPDVVDLLRLTTLAGQPVGNAIGAIGRRPGGPMGDALHDAGVRLERGAPIVDVLSDLRVACGTPARGFVDALIDHCRYGTALGPVLDRLAVESRLRRRRQAEEAARRLPVLLLFPLVLTILPACVVLAVLPLMVGSFSSLQL